MSKSTSSYPKLSVDTTGNALVSHGGVITLIRTAEKTGLTTALSDALSPWRKPSTQRDPGKIILDLALSLAVGGDCLADIATLREQPSVFGPIASDATVSRLISTLAADEPAALSAINSARAAARKVAWSHAGEHAPNHDIDPQHPLIVDLDATLVTAHSEKEQTAPNFKRGFGFHPLLAFVDHGGDGTGEPFTGLFTFLVGAVLGDVGEPQPVRFGRGELPHHEIIVDRRPGFLGQAPLLAEGTPDALLAAQSGHPILARGDLEVVPVCEFVGNEAISECGVVGVNVVRHVD